MSLFEDRFGRLYPVQRVHRIRRKPATGKFQLYPYIVVLDDEDELDVGEDAVTVIRRAGCSVLPAQPGTFLLEFCPDIAGEPPEHFVWRHPVLGFRVNGEHGAVEPVVIDPEMEDMTEYHAILHPCGLVDTFGSAQHADEKEWREEQERRANSRREMPDA